MCLVCEKWVDEHTLTEARICGATLATQAEELEARSCGGSTPAAIARMARA